MKILITVMLLLVTCNVQAEPQPSYTDELIVQTEQNTQDFIDCWIVEDIYGNPGFLGAYCKSERTLPAINYPDFSGKQHVGVLVLPDQDNGPFFGSHGDYDCVRLQTDQLPFGGKAVHVWCGDHIFSDGFD